MIDTNLKEAFCHTFGITRPQDGFTIDKAQKLMSLIKDAEIRNALISKDDLIDTVLDYILALNKVSAGIHEQVKKIFSQNI